MKFLTKRSTPNTWRRLHIFSALLCGLLWLMPVASQPVAAQDAQPTADPKLEQELQRGLHRTAPYREPEVLASAAAVGAANTVLELPPMADTYVASGRPNQNFGADSLFLGYNNVGDRFGAERVLVRFDIAGNIPSGATINSAKLRLRVSLSSPNPDTAMNTQVGRPTSTWDETGVTWSNQPSITGQRSGTSVGSAQDWVEWDVTDFVRGWVNGNFSNNGLLIQGDEQVQERERIFYARETNTNFFPRLVVDYTTPQDKEPPIVTVDPLPNYVSRSFTVSWHGSDRGGSGIAHYDIQYRVNEGDWVNWLSNIISTTAEFSGGQNGQHLAFRARGVDKVGNIEAFGNPEASTIVDTDPPSVAMQPLPTIVHTNTLTITWSGNDNGGSGIQYFDVRYRVNSGDWTTWQQQTVATSAVFTATTDAIYQFEVRAVDNRGQVQEYTGTPQVTVIVDAVAPFIEPISWLPIVASVTPTE